MTFSQRGFYKEQFVFPRKNIYKNKKQNNACASAYRHLGAGKFLLPANHTTSHLQKNLYEGVGEGESQIWVHNFGCVPPVIEDEMPLEVLRGSSFVAHQAK